ncbi:hypothetical protein FACS1894181_00120 [Bacteroidia bacterium]|nr:hypothetical protein FACS1894181_00120 [Bacteroidia bacterium]
MNSNLAEKNKVNNEIPNRSPQAELGSGNEIYSRIEEASVFIGRRIETARAEQQGQLSTREVEDIEKRAAFDYAKGNNLWIDDLYSLGDHTLQGGNEHTLVVDTNEKEVYKLRDSSLRSE